jgi:tripartite-type tricarboxylate transporter receptor subunit TctC
LKDFVAITYFAVYPLALVSRPGLSANTVQDLIVLIKSQSDKFTYPGTGLGRTSQIAMENL